MLVQGHMEESETEDTEVRCLRCEVGSTRLTSDRPTVERKRGHVTVKRKGVGRKREHEAVYTQKRLY